MYNETLNSEDLSTDSFQPIEVVRPTYILKKLMAIYLNELQGKEPLDLSDVTIPCTNVDDIPEEDELYPFDELDAIAAAEHAAGKEIYEGFKTDPCDFIEAVVDKYYSNNKSARCIFFSWYIYTLQQALNNCKDSKIQFPEELTTNLYNPAMMEALGANLSQKLPDGVKQLKKRLPFKAKSCYELTPEIATELIKHCFVQLYYLYNSILHCYYVGARQFLAKEEKNDNTVNTAA